MINDFWVNSIFKYEISSYWNIPELRIYAMSYYKRLFSKHISSCFLQAVQMTYWREWLPWEWISKIDYLINYFLLAMTFDPSGSRSINNTFGISWEIDEIDEIEIYDFLKDTSSYESNQYAMNDDEICDYYRDFTKSLQWINDLSGVEKNALLFANLFDALLQWVLQSTWFKSNIYEVKWHDINVNPALDEMTYIFQYLTSASQVLKASEKKWENVNINQKELLGIWVNIFKNFNPILFEINTLKPNERFSKILEVVSTLVNHFYKWDWVKINSIDTSKWNSMNYTSLFEYLNNDSWLNVILFGRLIRITDYDVVTEFIYNFNRFGNSSASLIKNNNWVRYMHDWKNILKKNVIDWYDFWFIGCLIDFIAIMGIKRNWWCYDSDYWIDRNEAYQLVTSYREKLMKWPSKRYDIWSYFK